MKYKLIIFDFDGTLADTLPWVLSIIDRLADKHKIGRIDPNQIDTLRHYDARQMIKHLHVPFWKIPRIAKDMRSWMAGQTQQIPLFTGITPLLKQLSERGLLLALVSSNSTHNVCQVLGQENAACFQYLDCGASIFGKHSKFKTILRASGVRPGEALCVGDEIRDIEAARKAHIPFGAVAWGYTHVDALRARQPEHVFTRVDEILSEVL